MQATRALFRLEGMGCSVAVQYLFWVSYVLRFRNGVLVPGVSADEWETEAEAVRFGNELMRRCFERHAEPRLNSSFLGVWAFRGFGVWGVLGVRACRGTHEAKLRSSKRLSLLRSSKRLS